MQNLLIIDGIAYYHGTILSKEKADHYFDHLYHSTQWEQDQLIMFGKKITTKRKVAWYGDKPYGYKYSGVKKYARLWDSELLKIKNLVESQSNAVFNTCLLNLYHDGTEGMGWHSDDEEELEAGGVIASVSLGAARKFSFKHKVNKQTVSQILEHGSLLIMKGDTQEYWHHSLPKTNKVHTARINLTFRKIVT